MQRPIRPAPWITRVLGGCLAGLAGAGALAQTSPWWLGASVGVTHESNLYRLTDTGTPLPEGRRASDTVTQGAITGGFDQLLGRQRVSADATWRQTRFAQNAALNHGGHDLRLALAWATVERISGDVVLRSGRDFLGFGGDGVGNDRLEPRLLGTRSVDATVRVGLQTRWSAELSAGSLQSDYSSPAEDWLDRTARQLRAGVRYRPHDGLSLGLSLRTVHTDYPRYALDAAGQPRAERQRARYADLDGQWAFSGKSRLEGRLSLGRTRFEQFALQDSSGASGRITWRWTPTGKMRLALSWERERGEDLQRPEGFGLMADASRASQVWSVSWQQELTSKLMLQADWRNTRRDLVDDRSFGALHRVRYGDDRTQVVQLGLRWSPTRNTDVSCDWSSEHRRASGELSSSFDAQTVGCQTRVTLR